MAAREDDFVIAVDSGGTFSDCVIIDRSGSVTTGKAPSTPDDFSVGVLDSVAVAAERLGLASADILSRAILFSHGTTVATNALLERKGAPAGLITTRGHEDAILIGRIRQKVDGLTEDEITQVSRLRKPDPVIPRPMIAGIHERIDRNGGVIVPLDRQSLAEAAERLVGRGAQAIGVSLLWSFLNPAHERAVAQYFAENYPDISVTLSSDLAPVIREYERGITVAINAYLVRRTGEYLHRLADRLKGAGYRQKAVVMQSSGGVTSIDLARRRAVNLITSGPAGGVIASRALAERLGHENVITTDVGGTSFDVGLIVDGQPLFAESPIFGGFQLVAPMIDVATIGAGGGSIAWVEPATGLLHVGPRSAGAMPGPVCYRRGGTEPTVTDANIVLGRINPDYFLGGRSRLDGEGAVRAVKEHVAERLGATVEDAALAIVRIAEAHMTDLVRRASVERGFDPRRFHIYAFGGAGPVHAGAYGAGLGAKAVIIPAMASEFSAFGIATADLIAVAETSEPANAPFDVERLEAIFRGLEDRATKELEANGVETGRVHIERFMRMKYRGQTNELRTPVPPFADSDAPVIEAFEHLYEARFGKGAGYRSVGIQALTYMVHASGGLNVPKLDPERKSRSAPVKAASAGQRPVVFAGVGAVETPVWRTEHLRHGNRIEGPAIIEAPTTTIVVHPNQEATLDAFRNIAMTRVTEGAT
ncbi:MAG: hydantoinase/oxoprolinase family protein [Rhodospirillales bacterium]|jgi:N-methylhydantoinase A|nr:hydantoinase/oxoprolinase family protein [Rhodospirillales bacterium]HJO72451.1 hydantoinase/oxoprolinase family protein [Rhodospirillales bacterium]